MVLEDAVLPKVGWSYPRPSPLFKTLRDHVAFYAAPFDRCTVDGEVVVPQPGGLLRRLDHLTRGRPVQRKARERRVVSDDCSILPVKPFGSAKDLKQPIVLDAACRS